MRKQVILSIATLLCSVGMAFSQPHEVGRMFHFWSTVSNLWWSGDYLYLDAGPDGLQIYDCSDRQSPQFVKVLRVFGAQGFRQVDDHLTVGFGSTFSLLDLSNPREPSTINSWPGGWVNTFEASSRFIYLHTYTSIPPPPPPNHDAIEQESIISIEDQQNPQVIYNYVHDGDSFNLVTARLWRDTLYSTSEGLLSARDLTHAGNPRAIDIGRIQADVVDITDDGELLAIGWGNNNSGPITILNRLPDDTLPAFSVLSRFAYDDRSHWLKWLGRNLMVGTRDLIAIWSLEHPESPQLTSHFELANNNFAVIRDNELTVPSLNGVTLYDISQPENPQHVFNINNQGTAIRLAAYGDRLYLNARVAGIKILDSSNPQNPQEMGVISGDATNLALAAGPDVLFTATLDSGSVTIIDVSRPDSAQQRGQFNDDQPIVGMKYKDGYLYCAGSMLTITDCRNLANPRRIATIPGNIRAVEVQDNQLFISSGSSVAVYDVSNPALPSLLKVILAANLRSFRVQNNLLHLLEYAYTPIDDVLDLIYYVYDISDIQNPDSISRTYVGEQSNNSGPVVLVGASEGNALFYDRHSGHLKIIEGAGEPNVRVVADIALNQPLSDFLLSGNTGYLAQNSSLGIYDFTGYLSAPAPDFHPSSFILHPCFPSPFNSSTTISFSTGAINRAPTALRIYDTRGRLVTELLNARLAAGEHKIVWNAAGLSSGVYLVRLETEGKVAARKVVLMR